jgi:hypothetical protein
MMTFLVFEKMNEQKGTCEWFNVVVVSLEREREKENL